MGRVRLVGFCWFWASVDCRCIMWQSSVWAQQLIQSPSLKLMSEPRLFCPSSGLESPEGIAIDHVARLLFWTDSMRDTLEVSKLDGSQRRVLFDTDLVNPRPIVTNPAYGWVSKTKMMNESNTLQSNMILVTVVVTTWAPAGGICSNWFHLAAAGGSTGPTGTETGLKLRCPTWMGQRGLSWWKTTSDFQMVWPLTSTTSSCVGPTQVRHSWQEAELQPDWYISLLLACHN